jgi:hypothetical protein
MTCNAGNNESLTAPPAIISAHKANECYGECLIKLHLTVHRNNQLSSLQPVCLEAGGTSELWAAFGSVTHVTSEICDVTAVTSLLLVCGYHSGDYEEYCVL